MPLKFIILALASLPQTAIFVPFSMRMTPERGSGYTTSPRHDTLMDL